jgi:hypothetical protein
MTTKFLQLLFLLLLSCTSQRDITTDVIKTAKLQITFFNDSTHTDSTIEIEVHPESKNGFITGLKSSFLRQESCPINGRLRYIDKAGNIILEGLFSQEYQSLFVSLSGKKITYLLNNNMNSFLWYKNPFNSFLSQNPLSMLSPTGRLGIISSNYLSKSDKRFLLKDLIPDNFKVCSLFVYKKVKSMDLGYKNDKPLFTITKKEISSHNVACILNSIISFDNIYEEDFKNESPFLSASIILYKSHKYYSGKSKIPSRNYIVFNFYDFNYSVGYSDFDKIFINSIGQECLNAIINK